MNTILHCIREEKGSLDTITELKLATIFTRFPAEQWAKMCHAKCEGTCYLNSSMGCYGDESQSTGTNYYHIDDMMRRIIEVIKFCAGDIVLDVIDIICQYCVDMIFNDPVHLPAGTR